MFRVLLVMATCTLAGGCLNLGKNFVDVPQSSNADVGANHVSNIDPSVGAYPAPKRVVSASVPLQSRDVERGCKRADLAIDGVQAKDCVRQELEAKDKLAAEWKSHSVAERQDCASGPTGDSYIEVLTCLEMKDWAKRPEEIGGVTGSAVSPLASKMNQPDSEKAAVDSH
jgi:hypothetical protein